MDSKSYLQAAECLKVIANPQRLKIIALLRVSPMTVGEIALALGLQSHVTSEHLRLMTHCGFLNGHRQGRNVSYEIAEPHLLEILDCIESRFSGSNKSNKSDKKPGKGEKR